jgi:hypothetical protein
MLCRVCRQREVEVHEHTKLPLHPNLCGPCYRRERYEYQYRRRKRTAKAMPTMLGRGFREVFGKEPGDPAFWLKPARA